MELNLPAGYRVVFLALAMIFAWFVYRGDTGRAERVAGLFVLIGITSTFHGIAAGLTARLADATSPLQALLEGLALSLGGSLVGFVLTLAAEGVMLVIQARKPR